MRKVCTPKTTIRPYPELAVHVGESHLERLAEAALATAEPPIACAVAPGGREQRVSQEAGRAWSWMLARLCDDRRGAEWQVKLGYA